MEEFFGQIIIPVEKVTEMRNGKRVVRERKLYPGYLMVEVEYNDRILYLFRETSGVGDFVGERFANLVTRESKCRRITVRPWHGRCSLSGDSNQGEYSSRGVPSKPWPSFARSRAMMSHAQV